MVGQRIASLLKASPKGEGFHPSQTVTVSIGFPDRPELVDEEVANVAKSGQAALDVILGSKRCVLCGVVDGGIVTLHQQALNRSIPHRPLQVEDGTHGVVVL
jgi:hypothetical protein